MHAYAVIHGYRNWTYAELRSLDGSARTLAETTLYLTNWRAERAIREYAKAHHITVQWLSIHEHEETMQ